VESTLKGTIVFNQSTRIIRKTAHSHADLNLNWENVEGRTDQLCMEPVGGAGNFTERKPYISPEEGICKSWPAGAQSLVRYHQQMVNVA